MGTTLKELLESDDLGAGSTKTASANATAGDADGMDKLAMQLGLFGASEKVAEFPPKKDEEKKDDDKDEDDGEKKEASAGGLHALLFPDSVLADGGEKTASEKQAAAEQRLGALAFDQFSKSFDGFIEKMASEVISGNPHGDSQPNNRLPNNKAGGSEKIDTSPSVDNRLPAKNDAATVGHFEQKTASAQAFRKQMLLAQLEG